MEGRISRIGQVKIYLGKCFRIFKNEKSYKIFISSAIIAIIISWVAGDNTFHTFAATRSGAFALICACIWMGIFNSIQSICRERGIIKREYRTGLHISSYIVAHLLYEMVICLIQALITIIVLAVIRGLPSENLFMGPFVDLFITFFLVIFCADVLAMIVSCIVKTETAAMTAMPFVLILQLVMAGVVFELSGFASMLSNLTISKWGVNAICSVANVNQMQDAIISGINSDYAFSTENLFKTWGILVCFIFVYSVVCVISLKLVDKDKR